jgi:deazaflavin-dependent oxidoreductase (nitroreductase family)
MVAPRSRAVRPFTNRVINPILRRFAGWVPGFAILSYVGRKSGRTYQIPMKVFRDGDDYLIALTYGREVQWVANVVAAGRCELRERGTTVQLTNPRVFTDPSSRLVPRPVRVFLRLLRVTDYVRLSPAIGPPPAPTAPY